MRIYYEVRYARAAFYDVARENFGLAERLRAEMMVEDGPEFTKLVTGDILEQVKRVNKESEKPHET